ncbi:UDP-xylose and UDP-N-acetylglucosamine transporter-like isoform X2 [Sycon ciliatum]|uniref:UDP-xylose and UDP-N-acetylglucosamine transporter-like isoform X2 n=1 Tax=Sycon ciliatum TaxID=27933 RepID=UPI0031F6163C
MAFSQGQVLAVALVFIGCCTNVVTLEAIIKQDKGAGNIVTFAQFLVIAVEGIVITSRFFTRSSVIPLKWYAAMVVMFFTVSLINNYTLKMNISLPLHMIFRASSLVANLILGILILRKRYTMSKYFSVLLITLGISTCTIVTGKAMKSSSDANDENFSTWLIGIGMLIFALFVSALMGVYQEVLYKKYGKQPREAMLWTHLMPLPGFYILYSDIMEHAGIFTASEPVDFLSFNVPSLWLLLLANTLTQYVCIRGVFYLTTACPSLTVTLIITLRKFVSLIFSIFFFGNAFTAYHWVGTACVFGGTLLFSEVLPIGRSHSKKE